MSAIKEKKEEKNCARWARCLVGQVMGGCFLLNQAQSQIKILRHTLISAENSAVHNIHDRTAEFLFCNVDVICDIVSILITPYIRPMISYSTIKSLSK